MPTIAADSWLDWFRTALACYDERLLREVATRLARVRSQWPAAELIDRCIAAVSNAATLDRRLAEVSPHCRQVLALMGHSRQPRWQVGNLVETALALGAEDGLKPLLDLLEAGLIYPELTPGKHRVKGFVQYLGHARAAQANLFALPLTCSRALASELDWPRLPAVKAAVSSITVHEADGLEWPLRLAALYQQGLESPLRRTQSGEFFKRDQERLAQDPLLSHPPAEDLTTIPDLPFFIVSLGQAEGVLAASDAELRPGTLPSSWSEGLQPALASLWTALFTMDQWNPVEGWCAGQRLPGNPFPSAYLLALMLLAHLPGESWARTSDVQDWLNVHHPAWTSARDRKAKPQDWVAGFLLGVCFHLRAVQASRTANGELLVRLSPTGRWLMGMAGPPAAAAAFPRTLLVQPNLEIVVYRQGLTPALIASLSSIARWQTQGAACTLQLGPDAVYRALETGLDFDGILQTLEQHGIRPTPPSVIEMLRTWSNKRERLSVYAAGAILEFSRPEEMEQALARGLTAVRLTDRLALVASEDGIEYKHFRLVGTRDYSLPAERCVEVEDDGVTLNVDLARSDLLLETELPRFAEVAPRAAAGRKQYRLTPASLSAARASGLTLTALETWFFQRTGLSISAAARLLMGSAGTPDGALKLRRRLVLELPDEHVADGLVQWPETRRFILERLGPTSVTVAEENVPALAEILSVLGIRVEEPGLK